jgi:hypothetical protein
MVFRYAKLEAMVIGVVKMDTFLVILLLTGYSSYDCQRFTKQMQNKVGIVMRYYPKRYIVPKRWVRKLFGMNSQPLPKYLYFELFVSIIYALLCPIYLILAICFGTKVAAALVLSHVCFAAINIGYIIVHTAIFNRGR